MILWRNLSPLGRSPHSQALILPLALSYSEIYSTCQLQNIEPKFHEISIAAVEKPRFNLGKMNGSPLRLVELLNQVF